MLNTNFNEIVKSEKKNVSTRLKKTFENIFMTLWTLETAFY